MVDEREQASDTGLSKLKIFDGIVSDESSLHSAILCSREEFKYVLRSPTSNPSSR